LGAQLLGRWCTGRGWRWSSGAPACLWLSLLLLPKDLHFSLADRLLPPLTIFFVCGICLLRYGNGSGSGLLRLRGGIGLVKETGFRRRGSALFAQSLWSFSYVWQQRTSSGTSLIRKRKGGRRRLSDRRCWMFADHLW